MAGTKDKIWNGGDTNQSKEKVIREWNRIIRRMEDAYDLDDSEVEFREDLVERERLMKQQEQKNPIRSKFGEFNARE